MSFYNKDQKDRLLLLRDNEITRSPSGHLAHNQTSFGFAKPSNVSSDVSSRVDQMIKSVRSTTPTKRIETRFAQAPLPKRNSPAFQVATNLGSQAQESERSSVNRFTSIEPPLLFGDSQRLSHNLEIIQRPSSRIGIEDFHLTQNKISDRLFTRETIKMGVEDQRAKLEMDLEQERRMRDEQNKRIQSFTEELAHRHHENSDLRSQLAQAETQLHSTESENQRLREEIKRLGELANLKVKELEEKLNQSFRERSSLEQAAASSQTNLLREHEERMVSLNKEWEIRARQLEEQLRNKASDVKALESELSTTRELSQKLVFDYEEKLRVVSLQIREEEGRRQSVAVQDVEGKLRVAFESRDALNRKLEEVVKESEMRDKQDQERIVRLQNDFQRLKHEYSNLQGEVGKLSGNIQELMRERDELHKSLLRSSSENTELKDHLRRTEEIYHQEMNRVKGEYEIVKREWESSTEVLKRKLSEMETLCRQYESEVTRLNTEYRRLVEMMQSNLNQTIATVVSEYKGTTGMGGHGVIRPSSAMGGFNAGKNFFS